MINSTTYVSLAEDSILITNTTLYCVAEDKSSPEVVWSYLNSSGTRSNLTATNNDVATGISTLYVYSNNPGYYSCEVTTEEGTVMTHTVRMLDTTLYTGLYNRTIKLFKPLYYLSLLWYIMVYYNTAIFMLSNHSKNMIPVFLNNSLLNYASYCHELDYI